MAEVPPAVRPARPARKSTITPTGDRVPVALVVLGLLLLALLFFPFLSMITSLPNAQHAALLSRQTLDALWTTILAGGAAIALDAIFGIPLAYWMARSRSWLRHVALVAALLPLAVPPIVGGLELVLWLGPDGWLGRLLDHAGLNPLDTLRGTILAQMFVAAPFVIVAARAGFASVEPAVTDAARTLGCGPWSTLLRVTLPAARRGIVAGLILGLLRAVGEFGTSIIVAYHPYTLANLAYVQLSEQGLRTALPTGVLLAALGAAAGLALLALDSDRRRRPGGMLPAGVPRLAALSWVSKREPLAAALVPAPVPADGSAPAALAPAPPELVVRVAGQVGSFALDVTLDAPATAVAILGSSGAGKSLTIRTMAGLLRPASGKVVLAGRCLLDTAGGVEVPAERRSLGYVSQEGALFRHLDVEGNVGFGLRGLTPEERRLRIDELLATFGLTSLRYARPQTLSGGERQQVALARAIAPGPVALLLDEPFSSLDAGLRRSLREIIRGIYEATGVPFVLVTHDRDDALDLADYVVVMDEGRVVQQGQIEEVFSRPANRTVARLVGIPNVVPVRELTRRGLRRAAARTVWGDVAVDGAAAAGVGAWELAVPPDGARLSFNGARPAGVVASVRPGATDGRVLVRPTGDGAGGEALVVAVPRSGGERPEEGAECSVTLDAQRCQLMPVAQSPRPGQVAAEALAASGVDGSGASAALPPEIPSPAGSEP